MQRLKEALLYPEVVNIRIAVIGVQSAHKRKTFGMPIFWIIGRSGAGLLPSGRASGFRDDAVDLRLVQDLFLQKRFARGSRT